jgi:hypothetical protein
MAREQLLLALTSLQAASMYWHKLAKLLPPASEEDSPDLVSAGGEEEGDRDVPAVATGAVSLGHSIAHASQGSQVSGDTAM